MRLEIYKTQTRRPISKRTALIHYVDDYSLYMKVAYKIQERLKEQIISVIKGNLEKSRIYRSGGAVNYTILKNPYYVVQLENVKEEIGPKPVCENVDFKFMDVQLCPHIRGDIQMDRFRKGHWYTYQTDIIIRLLQEMPNAALIDVGANIGFISVPAMVAMSKRIKVIAVEPIPNNVKSLMAALEANKIPRGSYAIIKRAMTSAVDEKVTFRTHSNPNWTLGGIREGEGMFMYDKPAPFRVLTATIDSHVLPVAQAMNITTAVLKMDIEGAECLSMKAAKKFFANIFVPYVMIEYHMALTTTGCVEEMNKMFLEMNYFPYDFYKFDPRDMLNVKNYKNWGLPVFGRKTTRFGDIIWKKIL